MLCACNGSRCPSAAELNRRVKYRGAGVAEAELNRTGVGDVSERVVTPLPGSRREVYTYVAIFTQGAGVAEGFVTPVPGSRREV